MARILITGASGFTGRYVVEKLAKEGHDVVGIERHALATSGNVDFHAVDLLDRSALVEIVGKFRPEKVIHLAAVAFVAHGDVEAMYATNVVGTRNLLDVLASAQAKPDMVVLASSANVYGNRREGQLDESVSPQPANDYGVSKLAGEHLARIYSDRLPIVVTRPFNYTGVGQSEQFLIPKIVAHARCGVRDIELGNLDVARDFSDVRAIADFYVRLLGCRAAVGETVNMCSGIARSLADVLRIVERVSGLEFNVTVNPAFVRSDEVRSLWGSAAKLESLIGPLAMPAFDDTIRWMVECDPSV